MKKTLLLLTLVLLTSQLFAVTNLKVNGAASITVSSLPANVVVTCDLAATGNDVEFSVYYDANNTKALEPDDILSDFAVITDGIGWIRDPENPDEDIPGDETSADKKLKTTMVFEPETGASFMGTMIFEVIDNDGSTATAVVTFDIQPVPPLIKGKITDKTSGAALSQILVSASNDSDYVFATTDKNGNYQLGVTAGTWVLVAIDYAKQEYAPSDSVAVPVGANQTVTKDFQLQKYTSFVEGTAKKQDNSPIPGIMVLVVGINPEDNGGIVVTDNTGYYKIGVKPGQLAVGTGQIFAPETWPDGFYADPAADSVNVAAGQTVQVNFTFKPYTSFIEGTCKVNGTGLGGVEINAMTIDGMNIKFFSTISKEDGTYKLGVSPGTIFTLSADKDGYELIDPFGGYYNFEVPAGQSVKSKDFTFQAGAGDTYIAGTVTFDNGTPAGDVYVVAINPMLQDRTGYLILNTDRSGEYKFQSVPQGQWKVGVYLKGYLSDPRLQYAYVIPGMPAEYVDFILGKDTSVNDTNDGLIPVKFYLEQNYPNPFKPTAAKDFTSIRFSIDKTTPAEISIYNITGQLVKRINTGSVNPGMHQYQWDGRDELGNLVPSGVYVYHLQTGDKSLQKRMIIVR